jgi:DNA-binding transcriptional MerR regulator
MKAKNRKYSLDELCLLVEMKKRTIRFYIQKGLVDRPIGVTGKGAYYTDVHLHQLLTVRKWKEAGLSLEGIKEVLLVESDITRTKKTAILARAEKKGSVEVWSHLHISDGVELHINPETAGLTPEKLKKLAQEVMNLYKNL